MLPAAPSTDNNITIAQIAESGWVHAQLCVNIVSVNELFFVIFR